MLRGHRRRRRSTRKDTRDPDVCAAGDFQGARAQRAAGGISPNDGSGRTAVLDGLLSSGAATICASASSPIPGWSDRTSDAAAAFRRCRPVSQGRGRGSSGASRRCHCDAERHRRRRHDDEQPSTNFATYLSRHQAGLSRATSSGLSQADGPRRLSTAVDCRQTAALRKTLAKPSIDGRRSSPRTAQGEVWPHDQRISLRNSLSQLARQGSNLQALFTAPAPTTLDETTAKPARRGQRRPHQGDPDRPTRGIGRSDRCCHRPPDCRRQPPGNVAHRDLSRPRKATAASTTAMSLAGASAQRACADATSTGVLHHPATAASRNSPAFAAPWSARR